MLDFLAQAIASIGIALNGLNPVHVSPTECSTYKDIQYCYYEGASTSQRVVYYLHGFGDGVEGWSVNFSAGKVEEQWKLHGSERPHILTISKNVWWYTEASQGKELKDFIFWFEARYLGYKPERVLYGESMGGHNAFRWAYDEPGLFQKLALLCPAFPRSFVKEPKSTEGFPAWVLLAEQLITSYYRQSSQPQYNPLEPSESFWSSSRLAPEIYLMATPNDDFGFYSGGVALFELLSRHSYLQVHFEEQTVKHCNMQAAGLASFLAL